MLIIDSLAHAFGANRVLNGIFLKVDPGEVVGIVGRNGCGKTTMLRAMLGTLTPAHMHLTVDDEIITRAYRSGRLVYLPQNPYLPRRMRVRRAVSLALPCPRTRARLLDHPYVRPYLRRRIADLSGGEQRRLEVLLAVGFPSGYVLLDEPFTEIEPIHRGPIGELIRRTAHEQRRGVLVTDHAYRDVLSIADRMFVMIDGVLRPADGEDDLRRWGYTP